MALTTSPPGLNSIGNSPTDLMSGDAKRTRARIQGTNGAPSAPAPPVQHAWLLLAPSRTGKTSLLAMLNHAIPLATRHGCDYRLVRSSAPLLMQDGRVSKIHQWTTSSTTRVFPEKDGEPVEGPLEEVLLEGQDGRVLLIGGTGLDVVVEGAIDLDRLAQRINGLRYSLDPRGRIPLRLMLLLNPLKTRELAKPALRSFCQFWSVRKRFSFDVALDLSLRLISGHTLEDARTWNTGLEQISDPMFKSVRLKPTPKRRRLADDRFLFEGPASNQKALLTKAIDRVVDTVIEMDVERRVIHDLLNLYPDSIVVATRADLIDFLDPDVTRGDVREVAASMFPGSVASRNSQVVQHGSYVLDLSNNPLQPIYIHSLAPDADELLAALEAEQRWKEDQIADGAPAKPDPENGRPRASQ